MSGHRVGIAAAAFAAFTAALPAQQPARTAVQHAVAAWRNVHTLRAAFDQTVSNSLTGTLAHATGDYEQRRPDRLAVRFRDPDGDQIVSDGTYLWLYLPSSAPNQVIRQAAPAGGSGTVDLTSQFLDDPFSKYEITDAGADTVDGRPAREVILRPKPNGPTAFTSARVWVDDGDGYVRQFEVVQANGVTRRVRLIDLQVNVPVSAGTFRFVVPKGVRVVER